MSGSVTASMFSLRNLVVVVVGAVALYCARLVWLAHSTDGPPHRDLAPLSLSEAPLVGDPSMPLAERSVLGTASSLSAEPLTLFLVATQPGSTPLEGNAQLGPDPRNPQTYVAGALLINGARLAEIHADHVVLEAGGQRVVVKVDQKAAIEAGGPKVASGALMGMDREEALRRQLTSVQAAAPAAKADRPAITGPIRDINEVIRAHPVFREKEVTGFAVIAGAQSGTFSRMGLQSGDVVVGVNGGAVSSSEQWNALAEALLAGRSVGVTVDRKGQLLAMMLEGAQLQASPQSPPTFDPGLPTPR
jgi:hypothetical protein